MWLYKRFILQKYIKVVLVIWSKKKLNLKPIHPVQCLLLYFPFKAWVPLEQQMQGKWD